MTFREWAKTYGGTHSTIMFVSMFVAIVVMNEYGPSSWWLHMLIGLPLMFALQLGISAIAWQITERRTQRLPDQGPTQEDWPH